MRWEHFSFGHLEMRLSSRQVSQVTLDELVSVKCLVRRDLGQTYILSGSGGFEGLEGPKKAGRMPEDLSPALLPREVVGDCSGRLSI